MRNLLALLLLSICWSSVSAEGITFGGGGRGYPYPNEPQYQYPYPYNGAQRGAAKRGAVKTCPRGQAPYQGRCRIVRRLP